MPTSGAKEIVISYTVTGAVINTETGTALRYRLLQGLSAQVAQFNGRVQIPTQFSYVKCTAGGPYPNRAMHRSPPPGRRAPKAHLP